MRMPKFGFTNRRRDELQTVNLDKLQYWVDSGRLPTDRTLSMGDLMASGVIGKVKHGVKVLGSGAEFLSAPIKIEVSAVSDTARAAIEKAGGEVTITDLSRREVMLMVKDARQGMKEAALAAEYGK